MFRPLGRTRPCEQWTTDGSYCQSLKPAVSRRGILCCPDCNSKRGSNIMDNNTDGINDDGSSTRSAATRTHKGANEWFNNNHIQPSHPVKSPFDPEEVLMVRKVSALDSVCLLSLETSYTEGGIADGGGGEVDEHEKEKKKKLSTSTVSGMKRSSGMISEKTLKRARIELVQSFNQFDDVEQEEQEKQMILSTSSTPVTTMVVVNEEDVDPEFHLLDSFLYSDNFQQVFQANLSTKIVVNIYLESYVTCINHQKITLATRRIRARKHQPIVDWSIAMLEHSLLQSFDLSVEDGEGIVSEVLSGWNRLVLLNKQELTKSHVAVVLLVVLLQRGCPCLLVDLAYAFAEETPKNNTEQILSPVIQQLQVSWKWLIRRWGSITTSTTLNALPWRNLSRRLTQRLLRILHVNEPTKQRILQWLEYVHATDWFEGNTKANYTRFARTCVAEPNSNFATLWNDWKTEHDPPTFQRLLQILPTRITSHVQFEFCARPFTLAALGVLLLHHYSKQEQKKKKTNSKNKKEKGEEDEAEQAEEIVDIDAIGHLLDIPKTAVELEARYWLSHFKTFQTIRSQFILPLKRRIHNKT